MKKKIRCFAVIMAVLLLFSAVPFAASAEEAYSGYFEGYVNDKGSCLEFEPEKSGWYSFTSQSEVDTYGCLYDEENNFIMDADDNYYDWNFCLKFYLEAGTTYTLKIYTYEEEPSRAEVFVEETIAAVSAEIVSFPTKATVYEGNLQNASLDGLEVDFRLSDGSVVHWDYDIYDKVADCDVYWDYYYDESGNIDVKDGKMFAWIGLDDAYAEIEFTIVENPVESIEITGDTPVLFENLDGEYAESGTFFYYNYGFTEGSKITVNYKDGTSVTKGVDEEIEGEYVDCYSNQHKKPWTVGGDNYFYAVYMGVETRVPVEVVPSPVESISVTKLPHVTEYEFFYYPLWEGTEVTINLTDGSKIVKAVKEEDISCDIYYPEFSFDAGGFEVTVNFYYDEDMEQECYIFTCHGKEYCVYDLTSVEASVITELNAITMTEYGVGAVVDVEYANGEKETFVFDVVDYNWDKYYNESVDDYMDYLVGVTKTKYGYAYYNLTPVYDEADEFSGYELWFLGGTAFIDADKIEYMPEDNLLLIGDADENGVVNVKDATAIQKATAGIITLGELGALQADADNNGFVNVKDATAIQKWLAGIDTGLSIGEYVN